MVYQYDHAVLMALSERAKEEHGDKCWPGYSVIAEDSHFSKSTVYRSLDNLAALGFILIADNPNKQGKIYTIQLDRIREVADTKPVKKPRGRKRKLGGKTYYKKPKNTSFNLEDDEEPKTISFNIEEDEELHQTAPVLTDIRDWSEDKFGISGQRLANCIIYQLDYAKNPYIRDSGVTVASMGREKFVTILDSNTPPGWTPENHGKRKPAKVETDKDRETREYYKRIERLKQLKNKRGVCTCGKQDIARKCVSDAYNFECGTDYDFETEGELV